MTGSIQVLHVDDDRAFADLVSEFLERKSERIDVRTETSPTDALEATRRGEVDCVVSDHDMPEMDGIELLEAVREERPELPFILFTGKGSETIASEAVSAGVTDYLQKEPGTDQYTLLANRIENVVERYRSQRAVTRQKRRLETLVSNLPGVVYRCENEPGWPMEEIEGEFERLTGYDPERFEEGDLVWGEDVVHPDDREEVWNQVQASIERDEPFECTYRIRPADDGTKWVWERGRTVPGVADNVERIEGFITDITESKRRERRFEAIFHNTYQFTGLTAPDGTILEANDASLSFAGVDREAVVGLPLWEGPWFQSEPDARRAAREAVDTANDGELYREEITIQGEDGEAVVDFSVRPVTNQDGEVTLLVPEGRDISELKRREENLRRTERDFEAIFNDPNLLVGLLDTDGTTLDVNDTAIEYVDADRDDIVGRPFPETPWWTDDSREAVERWISEAADGEYVEYDATHPVDGDEESLIVEGTFRPVFDDEGTVTRIVASAKDVTERYRRTRELERRTRELERRNERLDEFASFVSHDLQSPISTVRGRLELALESGDLEHVERAVEAIERVDDLRSDLGDALSTGDIVSDIEPVELGPLVDRVWTATDPPEVASYTVERDTRVDADADALQRLFENLVRNSVEHGPDDVEVRVGGFERGVFYEDDGSGIDPDHREDVFTPGFSTKSRGKGMGMASVRQIVSAHGWEIDITDGVELDGVRFEIVTG
ncbi:PAS domain S-box protein [Halorubrum sp. CBA1125]|uniref:PAS domain S-box protein n=1 Tax=Halorubrum sp. CBA1125 TaxID=2668072 RepID=UPI0012E88502|nr:PAS domain S-box protein [Halorubrum sp. CBA1125]MUW14045.1 PAS domain S-box protein [Halorubrum sp. CBA1125]